MITEELYREATKEIERAHADDVSKELEEGTLYPSELLYGRRMLSILGMTSADSNYRMKLAVQCQHIKRWGIPRSNYPFDRRGYHEWRRVVMDYQLEQTRLLLSSANIDEGDIGWILNALKNQGDKTNHDAQVIMDTSCLVFLKWYMESFAAKHENEKVIDILKKTMRKMSETGLGLIPKLDLPDSSKQVLEKAAHA